MRYLDAARQGKNSWWRYALGILLILFCWIVVGSIVALLTAAVLIGTTGFSAEIDPFSSENLNAFLHSPSLGAYVTANIPFIYFLGGIALAVRGLHQRRFSTLISADGSVKPMRILAGFGVCFITLTLISVIDYLTNPQAYTLTIDRSQWLLLLPVALILTPIQTSAEEFFFRGYLLQGLGLVFRQRGVILILGSLLFAVPHFENPEMLRDVGWMALSYIAIGVFYVFITLRDNRLELALGAHAANNLFLTLFINSTDSVIASPALFTVDEAFTDARLTFLFVLAEIAIFCAVFFKGRKTSE